MLPMPPAILQSLAFRGLPAAFADREPVGRIAIAALVVDGDRANRECNARIQATQRKKQDR